VTRPRTHCTESGGIGFEHQYGVAPKLRQVRIERHPGAVPYQFAAGLGGRVAEEKRWSTSSSDARRSIGFETLPAFSSRALTRSRLGRLAKSEERLLEDIGLWVLVNRNVIDLR
jgi:hypothetical protein